MQCSCVENISALLGVDIEVVLNHVPYVRDLEDVFLLTWCQNIANIFEICTFVKYLPRFLYCFLFVPNRAH